MRRNRSISLLAAAVLGLTLATAVEAQRPGRPRDPAPTERQSGAMRRGGPDAGPAARRGPRGNAAAQLLRMRERLALTDDQVTRLEALAAAGTPDGHASDLLRTRADLMDAMKGEGNLTAARTALDKMSRLRNDRLIAGLKQRQEARAILTAAQRTTLDNLRQERGGRGGREMRGPRGRRGGEGER